MPIETSRVGGPERGQVAVELELRVMGRDLEPREVSRLLGLEPTISHRRGDDRTGTAAKYSEGLWAWGPGMAESAPLGEHMGALLDVLEPKVATLHQIRKSGSRMDIFVGIFGPDDNFGFAISHELLERLARLDVDLDFDLYCCPSS